MDEAIYNQLKDLPDFDKYPLPNHWYEKFNIPAPRPVSVSDFIKTKAYKAHLTIPNVEMEVRTEPVPGGVRPILDLEPIQTETITKTVSDTPQQPDEKKDTPIEGSDSALQQK
jgi:hypothetical protein